MFRNQNISERGVIDNYNKPVNLSAETVELTEKIVDDLVLHDVKHEKVPYNRCKLMFYSKEGFNKQKLLENMLEKRYKMARRQKKSRLFCLDSEGNGNWSNVGGKNKSKPSDVRYEIWDYTSNKVNKLLSHLFITDYSCYVLLFDADKVEKDLLSLSSSSSENKNNEFELNFVKESLFNMKIYAPNSPIILIAMSNKEMTFELKDAIDTLLLKMISIYNFNVVEGRGGLTFFDFETHDIKKRSVELRIFIDKVIKKQKFVSDKVSDVFLKAHKRLISRDKVFLSFDEVSVLFMKLKISDDDRAELALKFLADRGLLTFFHQDVNMRKFVILKPEVVMDSLRLLLEDKSKQVSKQRVISRRHIYEIIRTHTSVNRKECPYLFRIFRLLAIIGQYQNSGDKYILPNIAPETPKLEERSFTGPFFVADFSGNYSKEIGRDNGKKYAKFLPFGFFEKVVSMCVHLSSCFKGSRPPITGYHEAILGFENLEFYMKTCNDEDGERNWIKFSTKQGTTNSEAFGLIKRIYSIMKGIRNDFFMRKNGTLISISILLPSNTGKQQLADFKHLHNSFEKYDGEPDYELEEKLFFPRYDRFDKARLIDYRTWFDSNLGNDILDFQSVALDEPEGYRPLRENQKDLPKGYKHHVFLSYKQIPAIDVASLQALILRDLGYKVWFDQDFTGSITEPNMKKGVRESMIYLLLLSEDVFKSKFVRVELRQAIEKKKPIVLIHHPDTGSIGFPTLSEYMDDLADEPELRKHLMDLESLKLERRYHLQEAVTRQLDYKLEHILAEQYSAAHSPK